MKNEIIAVKFEARPNSIKDLELIPKNIFDGKVTVENFKRRISIKYFEFRRPGFEPWPKHSISIISISLSIHFRLVINKCCQLFQILVIYAFDL